MTLPLMRPTVLAPHQFMPMSGGTQDRMGKAPRAHQWRAKQAMLVHAGLASRMR